MSKSIDVYIYTEAFFLGKDLREIIQDKNMNVKMLNSGNYKEVIGSSEENKIIILDVNSYKITLDEFIKQVRLKKHMIAAIGFEEENDFIADNNIDIDLYIEKPANKDMVNKIINYKKNFISNKVNFKENKLKTSNTSVNKNKVNEKLNNSDNKIDVKKTKNSDLEVPTIESLPIIEDVPIIEDIPIKDKDSDFSNKTKTNKNKEEVKTEDNNEINLSEKNINKNEDNIAFEDIEIINDTKTNKGINKDKNKLIKNKDDKNNNIEDNKVEDTNLDVDYHVNQFRAIINETNKREDKGLTTEDIEVKTGVKSHIKREVKENVKTPLFKDKQVEKRVDKAIIKYRLKKMLEKGLTVNEAKSKVKEITYIDNQNKKRIENISNEQFNLMQEKRKELLEKHNINDSLDISNDNKDYNFNESSDNINKNNLNQIRDKMNNSKDVKKNIIDEKLDLNLKNNNKINNNNKEIDNNYISSLRSLPINKNVENKDDNIIKTTDDKINVNLNKIKESNKYTLPTHSLLEQKKGDIRLVNIKSQITGDKNIYEGKEDKNKKTRDRIIPPSRLNSDDLNKSLEEKDSSEKEKKKKGFLSRFLGL